MADELKKLGEFGIIGLFRKEADPSRRWVVRGIGDDCAVMDAGGSERLLVTTDMLIERIHFLREAISSRQLGYKSLAVNISDIAAMGGEPTAAFLAMGLTPDLDETFIREFKDGLFECAREFAVDLLGGDTSSSRDDIMLCLTVLGRAEECEVIGRGGARPGDRIFLGGVTGDSAGGLQLVLGRGQELAKEDRQHLLDAHHKPRPQVELGRLLARGGLASAMIDVSDGVLQDLSHICAESRTGADLDADTLPVSNPCRRLGDLIGQDPVEWALAGGEDYVLLFCVPGQKVDQARELCRDELGLDLSPVGTITEGPGIRVCRGGAWSEAEAAGFDHFKED